MIVSHEHKFIFIKTRKTAGTSLEIALGDQCGSGDIITRISMEDERVRRTIAKRGAQNYRMSLSKYEGKDWKKLLTTGKFKRFENHDTAERIKHYLSEDQWNDYFKFCFERNPWDKMVSHYYWKKSAYQLQNFDEYISRGEAGEITGFLETIKSRDQYSIDGKVGVDKIYKYEEMDHALVDITEKLGLGIPLKMPDYRAKGQHRQEKESMKSLLSEANIQWIADKFVQEIELLNYTFPE
jgi:hypothetical protein